MLPAARRAPTRSASSTPRSCPCSPPAPGQMSPPSHQVSSRGRADTPPLLPPCKHVGPHAWHRGEGREGKDGWEGDSLMLTANFYLRPPKSVNYLEERISPGLIS